eukprot:14353396-Alexandrium_andersonii.AAC.1
MSASLVGSEMCIRDSGCAGIDRRLAYHSKRMTAQQAACSSFWRCPASVSYTHLTLPTICSV